MKLAKRMLRGFGLGLFFGVALAFPGLFVFGYLLDGGASVFPAVYIGFPTAGATLGLLIPVLTAVLKKAKDERRQREDAVRYAEHAVRERAANQLAERARLTGLCESARVTFDSLPTLLRDSATHTSAARHHYDAGAFSPFWSSIEGAYMSLGQFNFSVGELGRLSEAYSSQIANSATAGGAGDVEEFPVDINAARATRSAEELSRVLAEIVYEAQKVPVFAQIWEQRRTTAAVVRGFATLEGAVRDVRATLSASVYTLEGAVSSMHSSLKTAVQSADMNQRLAMDEQTRQLALANDRLSTATWYLNEGWKRDAAR